MKRPLVILSIGLLLSGLSLRAGTPESIHIDFYGTAIELPVTFTSPVSFAKPISAASIKEFYSQLSNTNYDPVIGSLEGYRAENKPDDWLFYQLIRKTAQEISPKVENYPRYTLYKWFLLNKLGYDAILSTDGEKLLMYVRSDDEIYDIPFRMKDGKKYACLNYHDYGYNIDFSKSVFEEVAVAASREKMLFSYKLDHLPEFRPEHYREKDIRFSYAGNDYGFKVKVNEEVKKIFANYPVTDYRWHFNIPMSNETYKSLIPQLKEDLKGKSVKSGVSFLMHFTRYSFEYKTDKENFGTEKRLSPEQTLLYEGSDCEDRVALFFYLVKEIYNLPMIVMTYPDHVSIAVAFERPVGTPVMYNGKAYSVCEPTPQRKDLPIGRMEKGRVNTPYEVSFVYSP
ncbi:MAG TPA: hypothetical protein VEB40_07685 [Flavipsychrobacter sp.]|nr:hypothetical protein [Flavipsychrobacter sp.]